MSDFLKILTTEAERALADKRNEALQTLFGKSYHLSTYTVTFHQSADALYSGIVKFTDDDGEELKAIFNVYIFDNTIYTSLLTLDMIKLIDVPFIYFISEVEHYISN
ncbi:hypothetical protein [Mucilaginibacter sp. SP1R1]|uniref:hypothetical protein n=1 Tax=Mucilaginibacter sp. SP1R1 TaxID=2723091 RepID=UPI00161640DE|nr:hypothetical protein [Mucilaginibacter sp. SP1R1]MBB6151834.1 hypothetical protein [Mucilaginibacter sp. SP1R1]